MLVFNLVMFVLVFLILTTQGMRPLNPDGETAMEPSLAFNTSAIPG
jgi:K+-transporting ATPase A subunit